MRLSKDSATLMDANRIEPFNGSVRRHFRSGDAVVARNDLRMEGYCRHPTGLLMSMGAFSYVAQGDRDLLRLELGRYCSVARGSHLVEGNHPIEALTTSPWHYSAYFEQHMPEFPHRGPKTRFVRSLGKVRVGHDVWIGGYCVLKGGIRIGTGAVVASGSVVVKDVEPYTIVGGNPARLIRPRFPDELARRLLASQWWTLSPHLLRDLDMFDLPRLCGHLDDLRAKGAWETFQPGLFGLRDDRIVALEG